jgi:Acyl-CoA dehydrogenase, C-terminal domain
MERAEREVFERGLRHAVRTCTGAPLDAALTELGWPEALAADPQDAVSILFELQGAELATSSALHHVLAGALAGPSSDFVLPPLGRAFPPGALDGGSLVIAGLGTATLGAGETALVVASADTGEAAFAVPVADLTLRPVHGIDPDLGLIEVTGTVPEGAQHTVALPRPWPAAVAGAQRALGHELVGAARKMLELARGHALERVQFGQAVSGFQAVRHRLAETLVVIESAQAVLDAAWEDGSAQTAAIAKALAGRSARTAARHCQQVLAGIGFTMEHEFHRYVRRTMVLDGLFGSSRSLTQELGAEVLARRHVPTFAPL